MDSEMITFEVWHDPVVQAHGFSARSTYAEFCLATVVGPTALLALRAITARLEAAKSPVTVDLAQFGRSLGVGTGTGNTSVIRRTLRRLEQFGLARAIPGGYSVRTWVAPLTERSLRRAGADVRRVHDHLMASRAGERASA